MTTNPLLFLQLLLVLISFFGMIKSDPDPLHDYCIAADANTRVNFFSNSVPCINPDHASASDFATSALSQPGDMNQFKFSVTLTNITNLPGLNTLGLVMARADIAVNGLIPPHSHPRASEVTILLEGSLLVGFVDTSNRLYTQRLRPGDCFVFPRGLIHFLYNTDIKKPAFVISALNSQNPGAQITSLATFTAKPPIPAEVLQKGFKITGQDVTRIRNNLGG